MAGRYTLTDGKPWTSRQKAIFWTAAGLAAAAGGGLVLWYERAKNAPPTPSLQPLATGSSTGPCQEQYVGGGNPWPGFSGFCTYPDLVQAAQRLGFAFVTRPCGYFWVVVASTGNLVGVAEYYGTPSQLPQLVRVWVQPGFQPVGTWGGGQSC